MPYVFNTGRLIASLSPLFTSCCVSPRRLAHLGRTPPPLDVYGLLLVQEQGKQQKRQRPIRHRCRCVADASEDETVACTPSAIACFVVDSGAGRHRRGRAPLGRVPCAVPCRYACGDAFQRRGRHVHCCVDVVHGELTAAVRCSDVVGKRGWCVGRENSSEAGCYRLIK